MIRKAHLEDISVYLGNRVGRAKELARRVPGRAADGLAGRFSERTRKHS